MSPEYFATCPAGLSSVCAGALKGKDSSADVQQRDYDDSSIYFKSGLKPEKVAIYPFFDSVFLVLGHQQLPANSNMSYAVNSLFNKAKAEMFQATRMVASFRWDSFRIRTSWGGDMRSISPRQMGEIESFVSKKVNVRVDRSKPDFEIWFIVRRGGEGFCGLKLNKGKNGGRERGELGSSMAYFLNLLSEPKPTDVFLDPFAGQGAIPLSRAEHFPYTRIVIADIDNKSVGVARGKLGRFRRTEASKGDALDLKGISDNSIDVIVTDPPWGLFKNVGPDFYKTMLKEMRRVLANEGRLIILTAAKEAIWEAAQDLSWFPTSERNILVSGKKAGIYSFRKN